MPSLTLPGRLIWFAHCPKAGGTSVEQFMVARWGDAVGHLHWGWDLWWRGGGWRAKGPPNSPQHLTWADGRTLLPRAPDAVFAVVRDPAARMASEHRWQRTGRRGPRLGKAVARLPFSLWLRVMLKAAARHPYLLDNHFRPQVEFVPEGARVFRLEDGLEPVTRWLAEAVGAPEDEGGMGHALPTGRGDAIAARDLALIGRVFAGDYRRFGYAPPEVSGSPARPADWVAALLAPVVVFLDRRGRL